MNQIQFFAPTKAPAIERGRATVTLTANSPVLLGPVLDEIEELVKKRLGVSAEIDAPQHILTFYGYEHDIWRNP